MNYIDLPQDRLWRRVKGSKYVVSDWGNVVNTSTGKWLSSGTSYYVSVCLPTDSGKVRTSVHRLVYETFVGKIPKGMEINHIDGVKNNNRLSNLEVCTSSENQIHAIRTGLSKPKAGGDHPLSKLSEDDVLDIYTLIRQGYGNKEIADLYGLHKVYVNCIRSGTRWSSLYKQQEMPRIPSFDKTKIPLPARVSLYEKCKFTDIPLTDLSKEFNLSASSLCLIRNGKSWKPFEKTYKLIKEEN